jgi:hypothetical protein
MSTPISMVLEFGPGVDESALIVKELDPVRNIDAAGKPKTSFIINKDTSIFFLVYHESGLDIAWVRATIGTVNDLGKVRQLRSERCSFSFADDSRDAELQYIPCTKPEKFFYGNLPVVQPLRGRKLSVEGDNGLPAIADVSYKVEFRSFVLHVPTGLEIPDGKSDYPIEIRIKVVEA